MTLSIPKPVIALTVTVLILHTLELEPQQCAATSEAIGEDSLCESGSERGLLDFAADGTFTTTGGTHGSQTFTLDMIPPSHVESPFYRPDLSRAERVALSEKSSRARAMQRSRRLSESDSNFISANLTFQQASFVFRLKIGTPERTILVIADTGSDLCWVECQGCTSCIEPRDPKFNPDKSSSYTKVPCSDSQCSKLPIISCNSQAAPCHYFYPYADKSETNGTLSQETLTLPFSDGLTTYALNSFYFGCGSSDVGNGNGDAFSGADGIFGLGQGPLSLVSQLGFTINYTFSYCLADRLADNLTSTLVLGSEGNLPLDYINLVENPDTSPTSYFVDLRAISVGGVNLSIPSGTFDIDSNTGDGGVVLDSGTTYLPLAQGAFDPLVKELRKQITYEEVNPDQYSFNLCYNTSYVGTVKFPVIQFTLEDLVITPDRKRHLFTSAEDDFSVYCLTVTPVPAGAITYLGDVFQYDYQVAFDLNTHRVGFAATTCGTK